MVIALNALKPIAPEETNDWGNGLPEETFQNTPRGLEKITLVMPEARSELI